MKSLTFDHYSKGCSKLGGMVETCVKMTKRLMFGSIKCNVLSLREFEFQVSQTVHIVNRRLIAFKEALRDSSNCPLPEPITPELLIKGYELISYNINPNLQVIEDADPSWQSEPCTLVKDNYSKLSKVKEEIIDI